MNKTIQKVYIWSGAAMGVSLGLAMVVLAGFLPPPSPAASGKVIQDFYVDNLAGIRAGMVIGEIGMLGFLTFSTAIVTQMRRIESEIGSTIVCRTSMGAVAGIFVLAEMIWLVWAAASYRPGEIDPDITRMLNDFGWILFLLALPPFELLMISLGALVFLDPREEPIFPRWYGYLNFWAAALSWPVMFMLFWKTGPLSYRGAISLYLPMITLGIWMTATTIVLLRAVDREHEEGLASPVAVT